MIIVSQDKAIIINFDSLDYVCKNDDVPVLYAKMNDGSEIQIGEYATEERAKEVLEEIVEQNEHEEDCKCDRSYLATLDNFTYRMPKE